MTLQVVLGRASSVLAATRPRIWRLEDSAVRTAERLKFGDPDGGLGKGPRVWTWEGWVRLAAWPTSGSTYVTAALAVAPNAELILQNNGGAIQAVARFWTEDSAGATASHSIAGFAVTPNTTWKHFALQANYVTGSPPTFSGAVWLDGVHKGTTNPTLAAGDIPHSRRFYFGLVCNHNADVDVDAASGDIGLDSWRLSNDDRHTLANFTPPVALYSDTGSPTVAIYDLRETSAPFFIQSNLGIVRPEWALPRLSAWADEYAGPWVFNWNAVAAPF